MAKSKKTSVSNEVLNNEVSTEISNEIPVVTISEEENAREVATNNLLAILDDIDLKMPIGEVCKKHEITLKELKICFKVLNLTLIITPPKPVPTLFQENICKEYEGGKELEGIAKEIGLQKSVIKSIIKKFSVLRENDM